LAAKLDIVEDKWEIALRRLEDIAAFGARGWLTNITYERVLKDILKAAEHLRDWGVAMSAIARIRQLVGPEKAKSKRWTLRQALLADKAGDEAMFLALIAELRQEELPTPEHSASLASTECSESPPRKQKKKKKKKNKKRRRRWSDCTESSESPTPKKKRRRRWSDESSEQQTPTMTPLSSGESSEYQTPTKTCRWSESPTP